MPDHKTFIRLHYFAPLKAFIGVSIIQVGLQISLDLTHPAIPTVVGNNRCRRALWFWRSIFCQVLDWDHNQHENKTPTYKTSRTNHERLANTHICWIRCFPIFIPNHNSAKHKGQQSNESHSNSPQHYPRSIVTEKRSHRQIKTPATRAGVHWQRHTANTSQQGSEGVRPVCRSPDHANRGGIKHAQPGIRPALSPPRCP